MINWNKYPYTDFHELNLDWIIEEIKKLSVNLADFVKLNTIKYADPILWDITSQYEANTVVVDGSTGNAYISTVPVPVGVSITDTEYWTSIFNYENRISDVETTLTEEITRVDNKIDTEISTVNDEITRVDNKIDTEISTVDGKIDAEAAAREESDDKLAENYNFYYVSEYEIDNTGVEDCSSKLSAIDENIGLKAGVYKIDNDCTISCNILIPEGATFNISGGVKLTITGSINAGRYNIFNGAGAVIIPNGVVYPEWFGALKNGTNDDGIAIQKAINALDTGVISLDVGRYLDPNVDDELYVPGAGAYTVKTSIEIYAKTGITITGEENGRAVIFSTVNNVFAMGRSGQFTESINISNIMFYKMGTDFATDSDGACIRFVNTIRSSVVNCRIYHYTFGIQTNGSSAENLIKHNAIYPLIFNETPNFIVGIQCNAGAGYMSLVIEDNTISMLQVTANNKYGIYAHGADIRDIYIRNNDIAGCDGIIINGENCTLAMNIHLINNTIDTALHQAIRLYAINQNGTVNINGGWLSIDTTAENCISIDACNIVNINGVLFEGDLSNLEYASGILVTNTDSLILTGCNFHNNKYAIRSVATKVKMTNCSFLDNASTYLRATLLKLIQAYSGTLNIINSNYVSNGVTRTGAIENNGADVTEGLNDFPNQKRQPV